MYATDTDFVVIIAHHYDLLTDKWDFIYLKEGQYLDIGNICSCLLFAHGASGCDSVSYMYYVWNWQANNY